MVKEIPIPTEQAMLVKLLMSLSEKYELKGSTITVGLHEVKATFRFPEQDLPKLREIANNWAERGYINAKHLLMICAHTVQYRWPLAGRKMAAR